MVCLQCVSIYVCLVSAFFSAKDLLQWLQRYGFSPMCLCIYVVNLTTYWNRLITLRALICFPSSMSPIYHVRPLLFNKDLSHWVQWWGFSPVCVCIWFVRLLFIAKKRITMSELIWFIPSICKEISCQTIVIWERLITLSALIRFLSSVCFHMNYKNMFSEKA